jgi:hypothetical protein
MTANTLIKQLIVFLYDFSRSRALKAKAKRIISLARKRNSWAKPSPDISEKYRNLWKTLHAKADPSWLMIYGNISGIWDHRYIPESIYYNRIEPVLNNKIFSKSYTDKNYYTRFLGDFRLPVTVVRNIEGVFYDNNDAPVGFDKIPGILKGESTLIIKPAVDSGGGRNVSLWTKGSDGFISGDGSKLTVDLLQNVYVKNFIIQRQIEQHSYYKEFNQSSVNTVRLLTFRSVSDESISILHSILRVGATGSITDNQASGGYACGLTDDGTLTGSAVDKYGRVYKSVNGINLREGEKIEGIEKIWEMAVSVAARYAYSRLLGLDICLGKDGNAILLEVNDRNNEINFFQMMYGPLFREFTDEVVKFCSQNPRSFLIDFEI